MTERVLSRYKHKIVGFELQPSRGGCFEVTVNGELLYSKLQTGEFPDENQLVAEIGQRLK